ncbi:hypothetical protein CHF27_002775 [Romboutsia maritimum]|uniref:Uncharacterized protein n=1 Tax=Romboutsia maritimum TaxID=2020948 RepID=A0A371IVS9_9FIRM|nr:polysaccharide biosynthesis C-terminal domain-containing protein [Romboutsia maritimum]RDY24581.1 hypothetical protein CHF27_002775 [Romboutsia maritimum]
MKRKKLILNALILTFTTMMLGFIHMAFRVYLSNKIGAEGMGLFQLIMSINVVTSTLAISGIRITTTRLVAEELGKGNFYKIKNIVKKGIVYSLFFSILSSTLLYYFSEFISIMLIHDTRAIIPLKIISCSLPFVGICSCLNGYFYGCRKVIKSVSADIIESVTMMTIIILLMSSFLPMGLDFTCSLVAVGMAVGIIISTLYSYILYIFEKNPTHYTLSKKDNKCSLIEIACIAFPIACSAYIQTSLRTLEDILIPDALRKFGSSNAASLAAFGMIKGMVLPILVFPSIFLASFSTLIIPEISEANALNQRKRVNYIISKVLKFTLLIAMFATGLFIIFSKELGMAIYNSQEVGVMMKILAPLIPLMYLDRIVDGSLNALNHQMSTLKYNLIDMVVRIFIIYYFIPRKGISGFIMVIFISTILNASLSLNRLLKVTNLDFHILDWVIKPFICVSISAYLSKFLFNIIEINPLISIQIILVLTLYFIFLFLFGCLKKKDIMWFMDGFKNEVKNVECSNINIYKQF